MKKTQETPEARPPRAPSPERRIVDAIGKAVRPETRLVAVTWVHSSTGVKLPIAAIAKRIREIAASRGKPLLLFVDGVHGFGIEDVKIPDLGCDAFMAGCHKWIFGPRGTGLIWANDEGWRSVRPTIPAFGRATYGLFLQGKPGKSAPIPEQVEKALFEKKVVASTTPYQTSYARLTPAIFNSPEEVEVVLGHVRALG